MPVSMHQQQQQQQQQRQGEEHLSADPDIKLEGLVLSTMLQASPVNARLTAHAHAPVNTMPKTALTPSEASLQTASSTPTTPPPLLPPHAPPLPSSVPPPAVQPYRHIPLVVDDGTYLTTPPTAQLLRDIGGPPAIRAMTDRFYAKAFQDASLDKFIAAHSDPHGARLAAWIVEKMGGFGAVWTQERVERARCPVARLLSDGRPHVVKDRTSAHVAAWWSPKRPVEEAGQHFQLHDCRVWMRLMFWSAREEGLFSLSPAFESWYTRFIAHFVKIYERTAPAFARESARWSADPRNVAEYAARGCRMGFDVLGERGEGVPLTLALGQLPANEVAEAGSWPYVQYE